MRRYDMEPAGPEHSERSADEIKSDFETIEEGYESCSATTVGKEDERGRREEKLHKHNEGRTGDEYHSTRMAALDKKRITQALCDTLELTDYQESKVVGQVEGLNLDKFGSQKAIETVALGVIRFIVNKERIERNPEDPVRISEEERFKDLMDQHDVSMGDLRTVKRVMSEASISLGSPPGGITGVGAPDPNLPRRSWSERPGVYWDELPTAKWVRFAKKWPAQPPDLRDGIPAKYVNRIERLREEQPWSDEEHLTFEEWVGGSEDKGDHDLDREVAKSSDEKELDEEIVEEVISEELDEEIVEEAAELVEEMEGKGE